MGTRTKIFMECWGKRVNIAKRIAKSSSDFKLPLIFHFIPSLLCHCLSTLLPLCPAFLFFNGALFLGLDFSNVDALAHFASTP